MSQFLAQVPFEAVGAIVLVFGVLLALWSASGIAEAYRSIGDGGLWLESSHRDRRRSDETA
jgi:hypothetical protein